MIASDFSPGRNRSEIVDKAIARAYRNGGQIAYLRPLDINRNMAAMLRQRGFRVDLGLRNAVVSWSVTDPILRMLPQSAFNG